jgi:hypothetical protein
MCCKICVVCFQAEVSQLEGSLQTRDHTTFPPYLLVDSSALCDSLRLVKQLTHTSRGIIIIPLAGKSHTRGDNSSALCDSQHLVKQLIHIIIIPPMGLSRGDNACTLVGASHGQIRA